MDSLIKNAIQSALGGRWEDAIYFNKKILDYDKKNIQALNRLAFSYLQQSKSNSAIEIYKKILKIDPANPLVEKNLSKAKNTVNGESNSKISPSTRPDVFIQEPGKTQQVPLVNTATKSILNKLIAGQRVEIHPTKRCIEIRTEERIYIGALPDDISFRIRNLIESGSKYSVYVRQINLSKVYVFIREV